jgi:predicted O-methyltransferase YrrM
LSVHLTTMLKAYLRYRKRAVGAHGLHSPFLFEFFNEVLKKASMVDDNQIQSLRQSLLKSKESIDVTDLGAGSRKGGSNLRTIASITKTAGIDRKYGRLLSRIVQFYGLKEGLELGTSMGLGSAYLAFNTGLEKLVTIEGCPAIGKQAQTNLSVLGLQNVMFVNGDFSAVLDQSLNELNQLDIAYIDGNHQYRPTIEYFEKIVSKAHNNTFIIFDDINWSPDMRKAWEEVIRHPEIHVSIELFRMGIVLKRKEQAKEHFVVKF